MTQADIIHFKQYKCKGNDERDYVMVFTLAVNVNEERKIYLKFTSINKKKKKKEEHIIDNMNEYLPIY